MTPEIRAARDRISAWERAMTADTPQGWTLAGPGGTRLTDSDIRAVLAALDQQPTAITRFDGDMSAEGSERRREFVRKAGFGPVPDRVEVTYTPGHRLPAYIPQNGDRALCPRCTELIEFTDPHDGLPGIWRHVRMPTRCTHYSPDAHPSAREGTP